MVGLKDIIVIIIIALVCLYIDKLIAKKIILFYGRIPLFNYMYSGPILMTLIITFVFMVFLNQGIEFGRKYFYLIVCVAAFLGFLPLQLYFIRRSK